MGRYRALQDHLALATGLVTMSFEDIEVGPLSEVGTPVPRFVGEHPGEPVPGPRPHAGTGTRPYVTSTRMRLRSKPGCLEEDRWFQEQPAPQGGRPPLRFSVHDRLTV